MQIKAYLWKRYIMRSEQQIQKEIITYLKSIGAYTFKTISSNRGGIPDVIACIDGKFIALEIKRPGREATPLQKLEIQKIINAGGVAVVVSSIYEVKTILKRIEVE